MNFSPSEYRERMETDPEFRAQEDARRAELNEWLARREWDDGESTAHLDIRSGSTRRSRGVVLDYA